MSIINVRQTPAEERIFNEHAKRHGKSLSTLLKKSLAEITSQTCIRRIKN